MSPNYHKMKPNLIERMVTMSGVWICPINFSTRKQDMLDHSIRVLEQHYIRINKKFDKLIIGLRSAKTTSTNTKFDKLASSHSDLTDCYQMVSLMMTEKT